MSFLNPWLLLGLLGIAVPTIIHLVGKRRAMVVQFPAFDFFKPSPNVWHAGSGFGSGCSCCFEHWRSRPWSLLWLAQSSRVSW